MRIAATVLALGLMAATALATPVKVGAINVKDWYMCFDKDSPLQVLDTAAQAGIQESFKIWGMLVDGKKCVNAGMPLPMKVVSVLKSETIAGEEYEKGVPLVLSVIELEDNVGEHAWAITGEPIAK